MKSLSTDNNKQNSFPSPLLSKINSINPSPRIPNQNFTNQFENNIINNLNDPYYSYDNSNFHKRQNSIISDNIIFREDINQLNDINRLLEDSIHNQRIRNYDLVSENEQLNKTNISLCNQVNNLKNNLSELQNNENCLIDTLNIKIENEKKLNQAQYDLSNLKMMKSQIERDYQILFDKYNKLQNKNEKDVECINYLQEEQEKKMNEIEEKVSSLLNEIDNLRKENLDLKKENENIKNVYQKNYMESQDLQNIFMDEKCKNDKLIIEIENIKRNLNKCQLNYNNEELWNKNNEEKKKNQSLNKIKLINELHHKIQNYRTNRLKRNYSH